MSRIFIFCLILLFSNSLLARGVARGYIKNVDGEKCWYKRSINKKEKYFHNLTSITDTMVFENKTCMENDDIGVNVMMINNVVSRWYSHSDANFQNRKFEMFETSRSQKKGRCIQSKKYPNIGIAIDYIGGKYIRSVKHTGTVQGCKLK